MKVSEMPYQRITVEEFKEQAEKIIEKIKAAKSAEEKMQEMGYYDNALPLFLLFKI